MATVTVRDLRSKFPKVLKLARSGETIEVTRRGKVVLTATAPTTPCSVEEIDRAITRLHNPRTRKRRAKLDVGKFLEENR